MQKTEAGIKIGIALKRFDTLGVVTSALVLALVALGLVIFQCNHRKLSNLPLV